MINTDDVVKRLSSLGYTKTDEDDWVISFLISKVEQHILNSCNLTEVPEGLYYVAVDLVCGEFLYGKLSTGGLDVAAAVKSIKEGDTDVTFADGQSETEWYTKLIDSLRTREIDFARFRRLAW